MYFLIIRRILHHQILQLRAYLFVGRRSRNHNSIVGLSSPDAVRPKVMETGSYSPGDPTFSPGRLMVVPKS